MPTRSLCWVTEELPNRAPMSHYLPAGGGITNCIRNNCLKKPWNRHDARIFPLSGCKYIEQSLLQYALKLIVHPASRFLVLFALLVTATGYGQSVVVKFRSA